MTKVNTPKIDNSLLYRRQYFFGSNFIEKFPNWNKKEIGYNTFLTFHPDLEFASAKKNNIELFLLGFFFDPNNPNFTNLEILKNILLHNTNFKDIIKATYTLAGRWALIYSDDKNKFVFNDPAGLRQIFYSTYNNSVWCAAQPHILAKELNCDLDDDPDIQEYINSKLYLLWERSWIGDGTPFKNIFHLLPNHYLDLNNGKVTRYWPDEQYVELSLNEAAIKCKELLQSIFKAAINRSEIAQSVTAGWDTRLMLAISKDFRDKIYYFVQKFDSLTNDSSDIKIPRELLSNLGLYLHIIDAKLYNSDFDNIYKKNVYSLQADEKKYQHFNYFQSFQNKLIISGNVSPIIKNNIPPQVDEINAANLARLLERQNQKYAIKQIDNWLNSTLSSTNKYNFNIIKLFYWENHYANWGAMFNAELDIAIEEFAPLNCRKLITIMLSIDDKYRDHDHVDIYQRIMELSWPEVLQLPINPEDLSIFSNAKLKIKKTILSFGMAFLRIVGLYDYTKKLYRKRLYR